MKNRIFPTLSRRSFLKTSSLGLVSGAALVGAPTLLKAHLANEKKLYLYNIHTGEWFKETYWFEGNYLQDALKTLSHFMRDRITGDTIDMKRDLFDLLESIANKTGTVNPMELISGYRCPKTNEYLRKNSKGVAKNSRHMTGHAADIRIKGVRLANLRDIAKQHKMGGVGYYPRSCFIHVDIRDKPVYW